MQFRLSTIGHWLGANLPAMRILFAVIAVIGPWEIALCESVSEGQVIRKIEVNRQNIFDIDVGQFNLVPRTINHLHLITRDSVIRREIWLQPGDVISVADKQELERNLRSLDLFSLVSVFTKPVEDNSHLVDLIVTTRDRLSLVFSGGGSFLGGVGQVQFSVGERNLFGLGHRLTFGYSENTSGELRGILAYDNVLLAANDVFGGLRVGQTEEGSFSSAKVVNRFLNLQDSKSWSVELSNDETRIDYYEQGESIAEVPREINKLELLRQWRKGSDGRFWRYGPSASYRDISYGSATGANASSITIPDDTEKLFFGGLLGYDRYHAYQKVKWLDTLQFQQDLSLGFGAEAQVGVQLDQSDQNSETFPIISLDTWTRSEVADGNYLNGQVKSLIILDGSEISAWSLEIETNWFNTRIKNQTLALRLSYKSADSDASNLPSQQSLGENNGLRGYPAREFNGEQRVLLNIEDRLRTPLSVASFKLGLIGFIDTGWVGDRNSGLGDPHSSAGIGLRIGSRAILGAAVVRIDLAYPFDDDAGRDYQPTISLAVGQVFDFMQ